MKWLNRMLSLLLALGTLAILGVVALFWLLATQSGTDLLMSKVRPRVAPAVEIGRVTGSVLGGLVIEDVHVHLARDELDFARLEVSWDVAAALTGVVGFKNAHVSPVTYRRLPTVADAGEAALDLLFEIRLVDAVADGIAIERDGGAFVLGETRFGARFANRVLDLSDVATESSGIAVRGRGSIDLTSAVALRVEGEWSGEVGNLPAAGRVRLDGEWPVLRVHHELEAPFTATADGELRFEAVPRVDLRIEWQGLDVPGLAGYSSPRGTLTLSGAIDDYRFEADGALDLGGRSASFDVVGNGEAALLHVASLVLRAQTADGAPLGELHGAGDVALDARTADLDVTARDLDPAWLVDGWPGRMSGTTALHAAMSPLEARFDAIELAGELRGYRVAVRGAAARSAPARWDFAALRLESGSSLLVLDGSIDAGAVALDVDADVADLDLLLPGSSGGVTVDAELGGSLAEPSVRGLVEARAVRHAGYTVARLKVHGSGGLATEAPLDVTVEADGLARGSVRADAARARLTGTTGAQRIEASVSAEDWAAALAASGGLEDGVWRGRISRLDVDEMVLGGWRLTEPADVSFGGGSATVGTSCLQHESRALACAGLRLEGRPEDRLVLSAQNIELGTLKPLLPPALSLDGVYQLSASVFDLMGTPRGALAITGGVTRVRVAFGTEQAFATELDGFIAGGTLIDGRLELQASVSSGTEGNIALNASIDDVRLRDSPIDGGIRVRWPDLGFLTLLSPELGQVGGSLAVNLDIHGTVREPEVEGTAAWNDGRVAVPEWGLVVEAIEARARSEDGRALVFDGTGKVGDGVVNIEGGMQLDPERGWPTELKLRGDSIRAVQLPEAEIFVTPDLDVRVQLPDVRVTGTVHVPRAEIELSALPAQAVTPSADAVVHGEEERNETRPLRLQADLTLTLGEAVHYSGLNLATTVSGQLRLNVDAGRSAAASGTLTLNGTYNAYGQTLQLERGELLFNGPLDDPGLSVRAVRQIEATTAGAQPTRVGVELIGTVSAPRTRVFSTPSMSEADALSYLLLGRPVTGSTGTQETATLQTAAISMGLSQALPVVQRIGQTLGLDELSVQTTDADEGALMAGKFLSPRVYIRYSYGLFNRIGGLLVRFKLNQRLSLETRSGDEKSMDLLYTVEKD